MSEATIIEGTATDVTPGAIVVAQPQQSGVDVYERPRVDPLRYLGTMSDADFRGEVAVIKAGTDRIGQIYKEVMRPEIDYGVIPGTKNPSLLQPGAERLAMMARLIPRHEQQVTISPGENGWPEEVRVDTQTFLHAGALDGPVVGSAVASCTSYEDRYLYRSSERVCPACQKPVIIKGNPQYAPRTRGREGDILPGYEQGGWLCWKKKDGCGKQFPDNDRAITDQAVGKAFVENPRGLINTLTQISAKRGFVGAIRHTLGITDLFTQDIEDMPRDPGEAPAPSTAPAGDPPRQSAPRPAAAAAGSSAPAAAPGSPGALKYAGPVIATPEGLRSTATGKVLAFAIKVNGSKHNVDLWGSQAEHALPYIKEGVELAIVGVRIEEDWPGRGTKAMKKVIKDVTQVVVVEGGEVIYTAKAPELAPEQQALPSSPAPSSDEPPLFDDDDLGASGAHIEPTQQTGQGDVDQIGTIREIRWETTPKGVRFAYLEVVDADTNTYAKVAVSEADALATIWDDAPLGDFTIKQGDNVRFMGGWNTAGKMVLASIVVAA